MGPSAEIDTRAAHCGLHFECRLIVLYSKLSGEVCQRLPSVVSIIFSSVSYDSRVLLLCS